MLRTFVDINGNIQYTPFGSYTNNPYTNSLLISTPTYSDDVNSVIGYNLFPRPIFRTNPSYSNVNNDPELRKRVTRYFYEKFVTVWLPFTFIKLQKYLKNENGEIIFIKTISDYEKDIKNDDKKIEFILDNIFSKHELLVFLDKFVNKNNANWYDLKTKYADKIKSELYDKLKNHMKKIVIKHI